MFFLVWIENNLPLKISQTKLFQKILTNDKKYPFLFDELLA
jgi:hypothetical protein